MLVREIFRVIRRLNDAGATILLVEQNARLALEAAHRAYILETGTVVFSGPSRELRDHPRSRRPIWGGAEPTERHFKSGTSDFK